MQLSTFTIILASLASSIAAFPLNPATEADVLVVRDTAIHCDGSAACLESSHVSEPVKRATRSSRASSSGSSGGSGNGAIPPVARPAVRDKVQVWMRVDTAMMNLKEPTEPHHLDHKELKRLTTDQRGQHTDVVVGNPSTGWTAYGLQFANNDWVKKHNNGNGAETNIYIEEAAAVEGGPVEWAYQGTLKNSRVQSGNSPNLKSTAQGFEGKLYNVDSWNCRTFAEQFIKSII